MAQNLALRWNVERQIAMGDDEFANGMGAVAIP